VCRSSSGDAPGIGTEQPDSDRSEADEPTLDSWFPGRQIAGGGLDNRKSWLEARQIAGGDLDIKKSWAGGKP